MTTCFGRAWPSSGHKIFTINDSEEKTYKWAYLEELRIRGIQRVFKGFSVFQ
jgi:hypothetical protein